jgi:hypothetical protein
MVRKVRIPNFDRDLHAFFDNRQIPMYKKTINVRIKKTSLIQEYEFQRNSYRFEKNKNKPT